MVIAIDFETNGINWWSPTFKVTHLASCTEDGMVEVFTNIEDIKNAVQSYCGTDNTVLVYNLGFEYPVVQNLIGTENIQCKWIDVMRLRQYAGVEQEHESFGLKDAVIRFLKRQDRYEATIKEECKKMGFKGDFRGHLGDLPSQMVEEYVAGDVVATMELYLYFIQKYRSIGFDWTFDHTNYVWISKLICDATRLGVLVDRDSVKSYASELSETIKENERRFLDDNREGVESVESAMWGEERAKRKTEKGKLGVPRPIFNANSDSQLERLCVGYYGDNVKYRTATGRASFASDKISQFPRCNLLAKNGKLALVETQCNNLLVASEEDGRFHPQLKTVGTITGRFAGAGGLNVQGLARRDKQFMSSLIADDGYCFVSSDASAAEPTITTQYSNDKLYSYAVYHGIGKEPYLQEVEGITILMIDDIYLMFASALPMFNKQFIALFNEIKDGKTFSQRWLEDADSIKNTVKSIRTLAKVAVLGLGYGMGATKLGQNLRDKGFEVSDNEAKSIHSMYWRMFSGLQSLKSKCINQAENNGLFMLNEFGYGAYIDSPHKAMNFLIQSTVNAIMGLYLRGLSHEAPYAKLVTIIHDEIIMILPTDKKEQFLRDKSKAESYVNSVLLADYGWTYRMRFGAVFGGNMYEAK